MKRVAIIVVMISVLFSTLPVLAADAVTNEKAKITIGYCPYGMLETSVMKVKQFHKKYLPNVEVEWFFGLYSVHLINNWIAGKLEIAYLGNMPAVMLQSKMGNTKWVGIAVYPKGDVGAIFVPNDSPIKSVKELDGKSIATGIGSSHHRILEEVMRQEKIKFNIVNQAPEVAVGNLEAGKIDAFCYWPPYIELVKYKKIGQCLPPCNLKKYEPYVNAIWPFVVSEDFAEKHPLIVKGLVKADNDLHRFIKEQPDEAAQIVYKELEEKLPLEVVKASLASYNYSDKIDKEHIEVMQRDIDFLLEKKFIKTRIDASKWADPSFSK
jgi:NitT/TauT family transport system substrate-binding protein